MVEGKWNKFFGKIFFFYRNNSRNKLANLKDGLVQSGASSRSKIGGAYFSDVTGSIQDPIAVPGPCEVTQF